MISLTAVELHVLGGDAGGARDTLNQRLGEKALWLSASDQYIHVLNQSSKGRDNLNELGDFYVVFPVFPFLSSFLICPKSLSPKLT